MSPAIVIKRLLAAGVPRNLIHKETGIGRRRIDTLNAGISIDVTPEERAKLEELAAGHLPRGAMAPPHHERCPPRYGR